MTECKQRCMEALEAAGIRYSEPAPEVLRVVYNGYNTRTIDLLITFHEDDSLQFRCVYDCIISETATRRVTEHCSKVNSRYRYAKLYMDDETRLIAEQDALLTGEDRGARFVWLLKRIVRTIDDAYAVIVATGCSF